MHKPYPISDQNGYKKRTLWHGTYLYSLYKGLLPGTKNALQIMSLAAYASKTNNNKVEVEQGTFTPLVFTSTGGMADECKRFHSRLAELLALKKGDDYAITISWIRAKVSFAILRSALLCLRGTRSKRRAANTSDIDITSESAQARI